MANLVDEAAPQFKLPDHEKHHFEIDEAGNQPYASPLLSHIYIYMVFVQKKVVLLNTAIQYFFTDKY
jgi:hypothetical protein